MEKESIVNAIATVELIPGAVDIELHELTAQTYLKLLLSRMAALDVGFWLGAIHGIVPTSNLPWLDGDRILYR